MKRKNIKLNSLIITVLLLQIFACSNQLDRVDVLIGRLDDPDSGVLVAAHRACWRGAPENSLKAIKDCIRMGVDIVEVDVRRTSDGHLVLMHDTSVDRTTSGTGDVSALTLAQISQFRLKNNEGGDKAITEFGIPLFKDVLILTKGKILVNVDAKDDIFFAAMDQASSLEMEQQIIIKIEAPAADPRLASFDFLSKTNFMPKITQTSLPLGSLVADFDKYRPVAFEIKTRSEGYLEEGADEIKDMQARLWINTMSESPEKAAGHIDSLALENPDAHWGRLIELGVNIFQTDEPEALLRYLRENKLR